MPKFILKSKFHPTGDQPRAIAKLVDGLSKGYRDQTLLGVTGSGKTFTMAGIIEKIQKPTLVISHNKTLAAQLYGEFKQFFPDNAVHYFVSYYDYYQPEAYIPQTDTYIEKEATINEEIDRLRHAATQSLLNRRDVLIVASVSCIYGLGERAEYEAMGRIFRVGQKIKRNQLLRELVKIQYARDDQEFKRGSFRVKGENIDLHLATGEAVARITMYGDIVEKINLYNIRPATPKQNQGGPATPKPNGGGGPGQAPLWSAEYGRARGQELKEIIILPAKHFMTPENRMAEALKNIRLELKTRLKKLKKLGKEQEAYRLEKKTNYDLEMMEEIGYCNGIENYSRHLTGRAAGEPPETLIDFFPLARRSFGKGGPATPKQSLGGLATPKPNGEGGPKDYLMFIDESHVSLPQIRGMHAGDQARKQTLIDFGFRLPSARDNRPLNLQEFNDKINQVIYVSATPSAYEIKNSEQVVEQLVRPTGLLDPEIEVRPANGQIQDLIKEIKIRAEIGQRTLVTTLTKRMAEELASFLAEQPASPAGKKIKVNYLHSEVSTLERVDILRDLRQGKYDVLVGINLLREGLDLPEVSLVTILDADMSGFLRTETSLIQTMGRAARHLNGKVIMYADKITPAMRYAINETKRRRRVQELYNQKHGITPSQITAKFHQSMI